MTVRKIFFWLHLTLGVGCAAIVFIMSITGVVLTFEKQMVEWADSGLRAEPTGTRQPLAALEEAVGQWNPEFQPTSIVFRPYPAAPVMLRAGRVERVYVDPYSGRILGVGNEGLRQFFATMVNWHRWLGATGENRVTGRAVTGAANLGFLFIILGGCYLWWPRDWTWSKLRGVVWFRSGLDGKARDFNWHNVIGLWSAVVLVVLVGSGAVISYRWASNLVYLSVGEAPVSRSRPVAVAGAHPEADGVPKFAAWSGLDRVYAGTLAAASGWRTISIPLPRSAEPTVTVTVDAGTGGEPQKRERFVVSRASGELVERVEFSDGTLGARLRSILRFAHTGEVFGLPGQAVAGLASLGACVLVWTGLALSWRRFRAWRVRRREVAYRAPVEQTDLAA
ncbi:MAG: PepSY-associated TM helix domain-containing protein [Vicinamibacterales bacterium]|jgi:uncharacterized iron-regulated membrane protein|nr:peptidase [Acidobacteriota bacterium]MDP6371810.1 PepSY-associated TM helix domain-containing protein [Vicinamibacterales bacterium]MDP6609803.1 PepSY-associated TM helix domain-containing protein [Vicinamibacterales bacterium]HAK55950.1 PepSY domain-containing protein [Acidobacteriota bacterium]|tara:strand:+ start:2940 stop:4118 length:1179 start_codon:yes stop_codon:yes gene_type:complete